MDIAPMTSVSISAVAATIFDYPYAFQFVKRFSLFSGDPEKVVLRDAGDWMGLVLATCL